MNRIATCLVVLACSLGGWLSAGDRPQIPRIQPKCLGYKFEAEGLKIESGPAKNGNRLYFRGYSNNDFLLVQAKKAGDIVELVTPKDIPAGEYDVLLGYFEQSNFGKVQVSIDGEKMGNELDLFSKAKARGPLKTVNLGKLAHSANGPVKIGFQVTGKNGKSKSFHLGIDFIEFREKGYSSYGEVVDGMVESLMEDAKDIYGKRQTSLILGAMERSPIGSCTNRLPPNPGGIRRGDRGSNYKSNMNLMQNFYRLLYLQSKVKGDKKYAEKADAALKDFIDLSPSPTTGLLAWGEHISYDLKLDSLGFATNKNGPITLHEMKRPMVFGDYYYRVNPQHTLNFAKALWEHQIYDQKTGNFSRHAKYDVHLPKKDMDFPKEAGYMLEVWADAYRETKDEYFLNAIKVLSGRYLKKLNKLNIFEHDVKRPQWCSPVENLSLAICATNAAKEVPQGELKDQLLKLASSIDQGFLGLSHRPAEKGFIYLCYTENGKPFPRVEHKAEGYAVDWELKYGRKQNAQVALLCYARMQQLPAGDVRKKYEDAVLATAKRYLKSDPDLNHVDIWPGEYGMAIFLQIAAYKMTDDKAHLVRAEHFADDAILYYLDPDSFLPKATNWARHYECITRCDTLALSLLALDITRRKLNVVFPVSDIDR